MSRERSRAARAARPGRHLRGPPRGPRRPPSTAQTFAARARGGARGGARADRDPRDGARAASRRLLATALLLDDDATEAERVAAEAVRVARTARSYRDEALGELVLADVRRAAGEYITGLKHAARARTLAARAKAPATERVVLADHALLLGRLGDHRRAREAFELLLATPLDDLPPSRAFRVLYNLAGVPRRWAASRRPSLVLRPGRGQATLALEGTGDPRRAVALAEQGLALPALLRPVRFALEKRTRTPTSLGGRARAERVGISRWGLRRTRAFAYTPPRPSRSRRAPDRLAPGSSAGSARSRSRGAARRAGWSTRRAPPS
ncbi:MAG: hypothetical protein IPQ09_23040 [Myxococcales bacterium]|nr:hypothetical protein [Myxococcales bacterium]